MRSVAVEAVADMGESEGRRDGGSEGRRTEDPRGGGAEDGRRGDDLQRVANEFWEQRWGRFGDRLSPFLDAGILLRQEGRLRLTRPGMLLANEVMSVFV